MKKKLLWVYAAILACSMSLASCEGFIDAVIGSVDQPVVEEEPTVEEWLAQIPGVSDVTVKKTTVTKENPNQQTYYYFFFDQQVDHTDATKGTFKQRVVLKYQGKKALNVLHTQGYRTADKPDDLSTPTLVDVFEGNMIEIEYRYFGRSLPEPFENLDFTYLYSSQASEDYHAIVTALKATGQFDGQWLATGTSKSGIAAALYAYYSSKKGYNDMDLYVPFCAPFCMKVDDSRVGYYMYQNCLAASPKAKLLLLNIDRFIVQKSYLSTYLVDKYQEEYPSHVKELKEAGYADDQIIATILASYVRVSRRQLFEKLAYMPIDYWQDYIPDASDPSQLGYTKFFLERPWLEIEKYIKEHPKAGTRAKTQEEMIKFRKEDSTWPYTIQSMLELGYYRPYYDDLKPYLGLTTMEFIIDNDKDMPHTDYPTYAARFSNAMTQDFIKNFLPVTTMPMIFVYGENDPWTGCAIPDPSNPYVDKIIVPKGAHSDYINNEFYCPKEIYQQICYAIYKYIKI